MRLVLALGLLLLALAMLPGCERNPGIKSTSGDVITAPLKYQITSGIRLWGFTGDESGQELLLSVPDEELKLSLALNPMVHIYDRHFEYGVQKPEGANWRQHAINEHLTRYVSLDRGAFEDVIVDRESGNVIASCSTSMKDNPIPICGLAPFALGGFHVELSIASSDLPRLSAIQGAVIEWLGRYHRGPDHVE